MSPGSKSSWRDTFRPNRDGSPWTYRVFRITSIRIVSQVVFFSLFVFLANVEALPRILNDF